ncbi:MAG: glycoside hydrolase family 2 TIM barrel-domain containing protein [Terracidiphilus sp.]
MPLSRRGFLEVSALSATGLVLENFVAPVDVFGEALQTEDKPQTGKRNPPLEARLVLSLNQDWQFFRPREGAVPAGTGTVSKDDTAPPRDAEWEPATLPHTVRLEPRDVSGCLNYQGICWYKRALRLKPEWKNRILYLNFQGAMQVADVWLNGNHLTTHYGGYIPFTVDVSKAVQFDGDNTLLVRLDNSDNPEVPPGKPQDQLDFTYFGGLYRSVDLQVLHPLHITDPIFAGKVAGGGIFVTYPSVGKDESTVQVQTEVANESDQPRICTVEQELIGPDGKTAATATESATIAAGSRHAATQSMRVRNASLWHPEDPQLYWLHTTVRENGRLTDDQYTRIGIRTIRFDRDQGLLINGRPFFSIGANRHQDHPYVGYALPPSAHFRDAYKLREAGFTSYRSHYPQDPSFMDACDELGILAIVSNPGWQFVGDEVFKKRVYQDAREMIRRDRNHPCVIMWEAAMNESDNSSIAAELYRTVHEEYPWPGCYTAGDPIHKPVEGFDGWDVSYVWYGHKDPLKPSWIREWGDQVDNWSDQQGRVRVSRSWGETPMLVQATGHMLSMDRICQPETRPAGADLWAGVEYYRGYNHQAFLGAPLDLFRLPKLDYFMFQSQRPPDVKPVRAGSGAMVFIANFATFHSPSVLAVFSNCEQVRLYQNGKVVATQGPDAGYHIPHPPFTFKVGDFSTTHSMLFSNGVAPTGTEIGELRAEGLIGGKVAATHLIHSPGVPDHIELQLDTCGLDPVADGADWVRVYARVCDARGTTYPYSDDMVTFSVGGQGSLIGDEKIFANPLRAEAGIATALVRTTRAAGLITVRASSPGLKEATVQFASKADWRPVLR